MVFVRVDGGFDGNLDGGILWVDGGILWVDGKLDGGFEGAFCLYSEQLMQNYFCDSGSFVEPSPESEPGSFVLSA